MSSWKKTNILPWWVACFLLGIATADRLLPPLSFLLFVNLIIIAFLLCCRRRPLYCLLGFFVGWVYGAHAFVPVHANMQFPREKKTYDLIIAGPVQFVREGITVGAIHESPSGVPTRLIVYQGIPQLRSGDRVRVHGKIKPVSGFRNPGLLDPVRQSERAGIYWTVRVDTAESVEVIGRARGWWPTRWVEAWRHRLRQKLGSAEGLIRGIILGDRSGISQEQYENFRRSGLMHLLAISGQHVGLVALIFYMLSRAIISLVPTMGLWWPLQKFAWLWAWMPVSIYVVLAGLPVSARRAWIMMSCFLVAFLWDQRRDAVTTLALAALLIVLWSPAELFTISFHLSFLAVAILVYCLDGSDRSWWNRIISLVTASFFVSLLLALPLAYAFGEVFFAGVVANLLALPLFSFWILPGALGSVLLLQIWPSLARLVLDMTTGGIWVLDRIADYFAGLDWSLSLHVSELQVISCGGIVVAYVLFPLRYIRYRSLVLLGAAGLLFIVSHGTNRSADRLSLTLLDVGQGDAIVMSVNGAHHYIIDGGGFYIPHDKRDFPVTDVGERILVPYMQRHKIKSLDGIILSHPHPDHYEGLLAVARRFSIDHFYWNGDAFNDSQYVYLLEALEKQETNFHVVSRESPPWQAGAMKLQWLYPPAGDVADFNDRSVVVRIDYGATCILLTGDIEFAAEYRLAGEGLAPCDILKVAHHGSRTSSTERFIDLVQPRLAVMGVGRGNPFGHPHAAVMERYERRGIPVWRTDLHGAITVETDGKEIWVNSVAP